MWQHLNRVLVAWNGLTKRPYWPLVAFALLLVPLYVLLVPWHYYTDDHNGRALGIAFLCGALVGLTEISSRYRDEQMKAIMSPDGLTYVVFNGVISTFALVLIFHFRDTTAAFSAFKNNSLAAAIAAGFGASAVMRTRLAVIKTADNKDVSIGPDIVINLLLALIDRRIDRWRAGRRQDIVHEHFADLQALGSPDDVFKYLFSSLVAFQNLSEAEKQQLTDTINNNKSQKYGANIELATIGFLFLTVVGEANFATILKKAKQLKDPGPVVPPTGAFGAPSAPPPVLPKVPPPTVAAGSANTIVPPGVTPPSIPPS